MVSGRLSQPVAGGVRPQILLSRTINRVMSKLSDDTDGLMAGYSLPHCKGFKIFLRRSDCNVAVIEGDPKTVSRPPGGRILSNVTLRT